MNKTSLEIKEKINQEVENILLEIKQKESMSIHHKIDILERLTSIFERLNG